MFVLVPSSIYPTPSYISSFKKGKKWFCGQLNPQFIYRDQNK